MTVLWTFENQEKLTPFLKMLDENEIAYELLSAGRQKPTEKGLVVTVDERDLAEAKRLLLKHKRLRTNRNRS